MRKGCGYRMSTINVCLACDENYSKYAGVVIASILSNAKASDEFNIYLLDGGISEARKEQILSLKSIKNCNISFVAVNLEDFEEYKKVCTHQYITLTACYRLKLASLLPNVDKIIYFDCDIIVNSELGELFNTDNSGYALLCVRDTNRKMLKQNPKYFNSGMLVLNLDYWRKNHIEAELLQYAKDNVDKITKGDQELLNAVLIDRIKIIDDEWNVQSSNFTNRSSYTNNPKIIHFVSKNKPWSARSFSYHKNLYFKYLQLTPWKLEEESLRKALKSTAFAYFLYRPFFLIRPRFYEALFKTYIKPLFIKKNFNKEEL